MFRVVVRIAGLVIPDSLDKQDAMERKLRRRG